MVLSTMMKQIVVIGGGDAFPTYDAYLSFLKNFKAENIDYFKETPNWKSSLQEVLGDEYEVLAPRMPNKSNAKYVEWEIWFEKMFPFLNGEVILVGHSLGASFLAKYLSEEQFPKRFSQHSLLLDLMTRMANARWLNSFCRIRSRFLRNKAAKCFFITAKTILLWHSLNSLNTKRHFLMRKVMFLRIESISIKRVSRKLLLIFKISYEKTESHHIRQ